MKLFVKIRRSDTKHSDHSSHNFLLQVSAAPCAHAVSQVRLRGRVNLRASNRGLGAWEDHRGPRYNLSSDSLHRPGLCHPAEVPRDKSYPRRGHCPNRRTEPISLRPAQGKSRSISKCTYRSLGTGGTLQRWGLASCTRPRQYGYERDGAPHPEAGRLRWSSSKRDDGCCKEEGPFAGGSGIGERCFQCVRVVNNTKRGIGTEQWMLELQRASLWGPHVLTVAVKHDGHLLLRLQIKLLVKGSYTMACRFSLAGEKQNM